MRILLNAAKCLKCKMVMASHWTHDLVSCPCGNYIDGGRAYLKRGGNPADLKEMSIYEEDLANGK